MLHQQGVFEVSLNVKVTGLVLPIVNLDLASNVYYELIIINNNEDNDGPQLIASDKVKRVTSGRSRGGARGPRAAPLFWQKKVDNKKTQKEEKPAGQAIFANQFCFNISKKTPSPLRSRSGPAIGNCWSTCKRSQ